MVLAHARSSSVRRTPTETEKGRLQPSRIEMSRLEVWDPFLERGSLISPCLTGPIGSGVWCELNAFRYGLFTVHA